MVEIYTDGSADPNPGDGGWGVVIYDNGKKRCYCGFVEEKTTNNKMELLAMTKAIHKAEKYFSAASSSKKLSYSDQEITIYTDSTYVKKGLVNEKGELLQGWIKGWVERKWKKVKNVEQWKELYEMLKNAKNKYKIKWVKAHADNKRNERADKLANIGRMKKFD